jgi:hypothetical protein
MLECMRMTLRTRRIFFWALIPCFLVAGSVAVLYSQGYRFDRETRMVTKVGALYVRGFPRSAHVTLDGETLNTGSWWPLQSGTLSGSLAPGTYRLRAEADGYRPWEASVEVRPSLVTERKSVVLFPNAPIALTLPASTTAPTAILADDSLPSLAVSDVADDEPVTRVGDIEVPGRLVGAWDGTVVTASARASGRVVTQILRFQAADEATAVSASFTGTPLGIMDGSAVVRESPSSVSAYDVASGRRTVLASSTDAEIGAVLRTGAYDAWTETTATSSALMVRRRGASEPLIVRLPGIEALQASGSLIGARDASGSLWLVDPGNGGTREVAHRATYASWRPDGAAVAAVIDGIVEVIPLRSDAPHGKLLGMVRKGDLVSSLSWYPDGEHLFVELADKILFADVIDGLEAEQHQYSVPRGTSWSFSPEDLMLYILRDGAVEAYAFPD